MPSHRQGRRGRRPARLLLYAAGMDMTQRMALAKRLEEVEAELQQAVQNLDGSPAARTRYQRAREAHREVDELALKALGARAEPAERAQAAA